nr:MAG TPA: hypothetical protein [Bacteriophage sp.]
MARHGAEEQRIGVEPHSFAREKHGSERRRQALNGNGFECNVWQRHSRDLMCFAKAKNRLASRRHGMLCLRRQGVDARLMETQRQGKDKRREGYELRGLELHGKGEVKQGLATA